MNVTVPIILALLGAILVLLAVLSQLPTPFGPSPPQPLGTRMRWIAGIVGCLFVGIAIYIYGEQPFLPASQGTQTAPPTSTGTSLPGNPEKLPSPPPPQNAEKVSREFTELIKKKQHDNVRDSVGTLDYQCFSDLNLAKFKQAKIPRHAAEDLKKDAGFIDLVLAIKALGPAERQTLLDNGSNVYRQSWSQLGIDPGTATRDQLLLGQTDAGSEAEKLIAESIVALVRDLCRLPESEIKKLET